MNEAYEERLNARCNEWRAKWPERAIELRAWLLVRVFGAEPNRAEIYKNTPMALEMCRMTENDLIRTFFGWPRG